MTEPDPDLVPEFVYKAAEIGDVLQDSDIRLVPDGWHLMDGAELKSFEWPAFVTKMGIRGGRFTLPKPMRTIQDHHWIIKLGTHRSIRPRSG